MLHKVLSTIFALLFGLFGYVQLNDPDPMLWVGLYGFVAVVNIMAIFRFFPKRSIVLGLVVLGAGCLYLSPSLLEWMTSGVSLIEGMSPDRPYVEESREMLGMLMALGTLVYQYRISAKT